MSISEKPLVGFFPTFSSMGETIPLVKIAKEYMAIGGNAIFFSHQGKFEYLAEKIGCQIIKLSRLKPEYHGQIQKMYQDGKPFEEILINQYSEKTIAFAVEEEIQAFKESNISLLVSTFNLTSGISARAVDIPLVVVTSGTTIQPYYQSGNVSFPEQYENIGTRCLPQFLKDKIARWYLLNNKTLAKEFNKVAKHYQIPLFRNTNEVLMGDHTLVCDNLTFLGVQPTCEFPRDNFIGPIIGGDLFKNSKKTIDPEILQHIDNAKRSIVVVMGSADKHMNLLLNIIKVLENTDYQVIAVYSNSQKNDVNQITSDNILFRGFLPLDEILNKVDIAITHGGRGTIYTIALSGKPAICIPIIAEHQFNIDNLVRLGSAIRLSRKFYSNSKLLQSLKKIFDDYEQYQKNAKQLADILLKEPPGEKKGVQRLIEILKQYNRI